jgi:hypothetical protein
LGSAAVKEVERLRPRGGGSSKAETVRLSQGLGPRSAEQCQCPISRRSVTNGV